MKRRHIIFVFSTILAITLSANYWFSISPLDSLATIRPSTADYFFDNPSIKQFNSQGQLTNLLKAEKLEHYKNSNLSQVSKPQIIVTSLTQGKWAITAQSAQLTHQTDFLELSGDVLIQQIISPSDNSNRLIQINTPLLAFNLAENTAQANQGIKVKTPQIETQANHLSVNFKTEQVSLGGGVQTKGFIDDSKE